MEGPSAFSNISDVETASSCRISRESLVSAFWNAASFPEVLRIPFAAVDGSIKQLWDYWHVDLSEYGVDYRDLFAGLALFQVDILAPPVRLVRAWYHAWDGDSFGGLTPQNFSSMMKTLCTQAEDASKMDRLVNPALPDLVRASGELRRGSKNLNDIMTAWANAKRLSKRFGAEYLKGAIAAGEEAPSFLPVVWSPYDSAIEASEVSAPRIQLDVICAWLSEFEVAWSFPLRALSLLMPMDRTGLYSSLVSLFALSIYYVTHFASLPLPPRS